MNLSKFEEAVSQSALPDSNVSLYEGAMEIIETVVYSGKSLVNEIDMNSFTYEQAKHALDHVISLEPAESEEEAESNRNNLLNQINRVAHAKQILDKVRPKGMRRRFI